MATLFPGSRPDAPRLKVDVTTFMKFVASEKDWGAHASLELPLLLKKTPH